MNPGIYILSLLIYPIVFFLFINNFDQTISCSCDKRECQLQFNKFDVICKSFHFLKLLFISRFRFCLLHSGIIVHWLGLEALLGFAFQFVVPPTMLA